MKRRVIAIVAFMVVFVMFPTKQAAASAASSDFRAVWVATLINLDYPSSQGLSIAKLKSEADTVISTAKDIGLNAIILQVRPCSDALYKSELFPWSKYLSGQQGKAPEDGFDPLEYWIQKAHENGLELHAWINPFRADRLNTDVSLLAENHPARLHPDWTVAHSDKNLYYNPGLASVRKLVIDGVTEIVKNYDVDGIQFDDYFYPDGDFNDGNTFEKYGKGYTDINNWRRDNINTLIKDTYDAIKAIRSECVFGVSPAGIWANKSSSPFGSDTGGHESYSQSFADTRKWVKNEWLDYIAPQIYWEIGHNKADYSKVLQWWVDQVNGTNVKLYVGHATYRLNDDSSSSPWYGTKEIKNQIELSNTYSAVTGSIHFRYKFLENAATKETLKKLYSVAVNTAASNVLMPEPTIGALNIGRPSSSTISYSGDRYYIMGASDPAKPITVNGKAIEGRTSLGYFGYYATIAKGANTFVFAQGTSSVTITINRDISTTQVSPPTMEAAEILTGTAFPSGADEIYQGGDTVKLSCVAPVGATVYAFFAGQRIPLEPAATSKPDDGKFYKTTFAGTFDLNGYTIKGRIVNLGSPVYVMEYNGKNNARAATASIRCSTPHSDLAAVVISDFAFVYPKSTTSGGSAGELGKGQTGRVIGLTSNASWVQVSVAGNEGVWLQAADVELKTIDLGTAYPPSSSRYTVGEKWDSFTLSTKLFSITKVDYAGENTITVTINDVDACPLPTLPKNSVMGTVTAEMVGNAAVYTFTLRGGMRIDGYLTAKTDEGIELLIKRPIKAGTGAKPLSDLTIVVDAGHGGDDPGAQGAWGTDFSEKYVAFYAQHKLQKELESLGAEVFITRTGDYTTELKDRVAINREHMADLFVSLHCNSVSENADSSSIRGLSTHYRNVLSAPISQYVADAVTADLGVRNRKHNQMNLYVGRPSWSPSFLVEMGFICNPQDFQWLTSNQQLNELTHSIAKAITGYFS